MAIDFPCGNCGSGLRAENRDFGKQLKCPGCGASAIVPAWSVPLSPHRPEASSAGREALGRATSESDQGDSVTGTDASGGVSPIGSRPAFTPDFDPWSSKYAPGVTRYGSIGGWLVLPAIGLVLTPIVRGFNALLDAALLEDRLPGGVRDLLVFDMVGNLALGFWCILVAVGFFQRRQSAPRAVIVLLIANVLFAIIAYGSLMSVAQAPVSLRSDAAADVVKACLSSGIWIWYFAVSSRVKGTFVR